MPSLTKRQKEMLDFLTDALEANGYAPSLEEMAKALGLRSIATVHGHLKNLEEKGLIRRGWNRSRSLEIMAPRKNSASPPGLVELPLLGKVAAGEPIEAIENRESIQVPEEFVGSRETFVLQVQGDSMIDEQIRSGDMVIVERRETAENGETVVALTDPGGATVKKFYREGNRVKLVPANRHLKPLWFDGSQVQIQGVVIGLLRKYGGNRS